jgi:hypothetical protein
MLPNKLFGDIAMPTMQELGIDKWSYEQKLELLLEIWLSLKCYLGPIPAPDQDRILLQIELFEADPYHMLPWKEIEKYLVMPDLTVYSPPA